MQMSTRLIAAAAFGCLASSPAAAAVITLPISANGANEVTAAGAPNQGDPDGSAIGFIVLNNGTGTTGTATVSVTLSNLDVDTLNLTGHHIHQGPATTTGPIVLDFGDPDAVRIGNTLSGTLTGLSAATITAVIANPTGFYYNIHNAQFPGGAVRSQLPEPGGLGVLGATGAGLLARRRPR